MWNYNFSSIFHGISLGEIVINNHLFGTHDDYGLGLMVAEHSQDLGSSSIECIALVDNDTSLRLAQDTFFFVDQFWTYLKQKIVSGENDKLFLFLRVR